MFNGVPGKEVFMEIRIIMILDITLFISSCLRNEVDFIPVSAEINDKPVIYIYRQNNLSNITVSPDLLIDGKKEISIKIILMLLSCLTLGNIILNFC